MSEIDDLASMLRQAHRAVFFGGAGVSTESGIPDFRSDTGIYTLAAGGEYPPEFMLSHTCWRDYPEDFYAFYRTHMLYPDAQPNPAHRALAVMEQQGRLAGVITQNIDGLHQMAGSRRVIELHGSVHRNSCLTCHRTYDMDVILHSTGVPRCTSCGGVIKPDVVLYEEPLDAEALQGAARLLTDADVAVVGGTSLNVYPAAGLVDFYRGDRLVLINRTPTPADRRADLVIRAPIGEVLAAVAH